ncbi:hypothetical protein KCP73_10465 [Salmonella enterica subsp. enterica]|nr:hypothetical protein KCP73_10465 [Salmonella enterica subsp. enterica]
MIRRGEIDGVVVMSADPVKAKPVPFAAAVEMMKPPIALAIPGKPAAPRGKGTKCGRDPPEQSAGTTSRTRAASARRQ